MNAIVPLPDSLDGRTEHQLGMCREVADLAMDMLRAAARKAAREAAAEEQCGEPDPGGLKGRNTPDPVQQFIRLTAVVRQFITLETRIAAGSPTPASPASSQAGSSPGGSSTAGSSPTGAKPAPDPRRATLRQCLDEMTSRHPDRTALRRGAADLIDRQLAADPAAAKPLPDIVAAVCEGLGVAPDLAQVSDEILEILFPPDAPGPRELEPAALKRICEAIPAAASHRRR